MKCEIGFFKYTSSSSFSSMSRKAGTVVASCGIGRIGQVLRCASGESETHLLYNPEAVPSHLLKRLAQSRSELSGTLLSQHLASLVRAADQNLRLLETESSFDADLDALSRIG